MHKKSFIIFISIATVLLIAGITASLILLNNNDNTLPIDTDIPANTEITVPPIEGNTVISEEREVLLDKNIFALIEQSSAKIPLVNEDGNYVTDENGDLIYDDAYTSDYTNVKENLVVIVNEFADTGYSDMVIKYVQRFYFEYCNQLISYESEDLIHKLMYCFNVSGNTCEQISKAVFETFGFDREDEFAFVFKEMLPPSENIVLFYEVKPIVTFEWNSNLEKHCIYNIWYAEDSDKSYKRNAEAYLHIIVCNMNEVGASEFDIRLAQLLYCGFIADAEYSADWLERLMLAFSEGTPDYDSLRNTMLNEFGFDIYSNQIVSFYYEGITEFNPEVN